MSDIFKNLPYCKSPCKDCPFRKDSTSGWLGKDRIIDILNETSFVCHKNNALQCAGHMTIKGQDNEFNRKAKEMFGEKPPIKNQEKIFSSENELIEHHSINQ